MAGHALEIVCTACGEEALLRREPVYEGFKKVGEKLSCTACGHAFSEEDVPYKQKSATSVFSDEDVPRKVDIFSEEERGRNCRHCEHYVVNPFTQRCSLHDKAVEATDLCFDFSPKPDDRDPEEGVGDITAAGDASS